MTELTMPIHTISTLMMAGLIWFVRIVDDPLMDAAGAKEFERYESRRTRRTTAVVAPLMAAEG